MRTPNAEIAPLAAIALHDVSPATWPMCERLVTLISSIRADVPLTLLVVPDMHRRASILDAPDFRRAIDALLARNCEIALHGLWHLDDGRPSDSIRAALARRLLTAGEGEFVALDGGSARGRIELGLGLLRRCGWQPQGFVPPAWLISEQASHVLGEFPFDYTTSLGSITQLPRARRWDVPCLGFSARSAPRRELSTRWIAWQLTQLAKAPALRIALHPLDAHYDLTFKTWRRLLERVLRERQPVTKSALCRALAADMRS